jgi:hypothetical protein
LTALYSQWRGPGNKLLCDSVSDASPAIRIQTDILRLLAAHRDPESYVAGATPLNRDAPRISSDIDVFHDREERVRQR